MRSISSGCKEAQPWNLGMARCGSMSHSNGGQMPSAQARAAAGAIARHGIRLLCICEVVNPRLLSKPGDRQSLAQDWVSSTWTIPAVARRLLMDYRTLA
jgi:hypothetical protein